MEKLTAKQAAFCKEYLIDLNATQAAIRAGYSEKTAGAAAGRMLQNVKIREQMQKGMDKRSERTEITADYVLGTIKETVERCRQGEPVRDRKGELVMIDTPDGEVAPAYKFDSNGVLKGCELLGKNIKLFTDVIEANVKATVSSEPLSDEEWQNKYTGEKS